MRSDWIERKKSSEPWMSGSGSIMHPNHHQITNTGKSKVKSGKSSIGSCRHSTRSFRSVDVGNPVDRALTIIYVRVPLDLISLSLSHSFFLSLLFDRFSYVEPPHQVQVRPVLSGHGPRTQDSGPGRTGGFRLIRGSRLIRWVQADQGAQVSGRTSVSRLIRWVHADMGAQVGPA